MECGFNLFDKEEDLVLESCHNNVRFASDDEVFGVGVLEAEAHTRVASLCKCLGSDYPQLCAYVKANYCSDDVRSLSNMFNEHEFALAGHRVRCDPGKGCVVGDCAGSHEVFLVIGQKVFYYIVTPVGYLYVRRFPYTEMRLNLNLTYGAVQVYVCDCEKCCDGNLSVHGECVLWCAERDNMTIDLMQAISEKDRDIIRSFVLKRPFSVFFPHRNIFFIIHFLSGLGLCPDYQVDDMFDCHFKSSDYYVSEDLTFYPSVELNLTPPVYVTSPSYRFAASSP